MVTIQPNIPKLSKHTHFDLEFLVMVHFVLLDQLYMLSLSPLFNFKVANSHLFFLFKKHGNSIQ